MLQKKSFLERLTGSIKFEENEDNNLKENIINHSQNKFIQEQENNNLTKELKIEEEADAELTVDVYQTQTDIIVQTMVAGVQPENLSLTITRDTIMIHGKREENKSIDKDNYFVQELYWGSFSRTISLPEEIDVEEAGATERHGLLIIRLPKLDKNRETKLKIKSI